MPSKGEFMLKLLMTGLLGAVLAMPVAAQKNDATDADLRCVAIFSIEAGSAREEARAPFSMAIYYFLGHLDGIAPDIDLPAEMKRTMSTLTAQQIADEEKRCDEIMSSKGGTRMLAVLKALQEAGQKKSPGN
jgi:hypothetical protein